MKRIVALLMLPPFFFCLPALNCFAQTDANHGIQWTSGLTWEQVKQKAKQEDKFIFLDCFATWCSPCHQMDKDVYPDEEVGKAVNDKFISVKVQIDKTAYDNDMVKKWYNDAARIEKNYTITAFPTFLFFSPDGKPLHRAIGYREPAQFISLTVDALNPQKQYYALLNNYKTGTIDTSELKGLARALRSLGGDLAANMAIEYLTRIPKKEISKPDNLNLMMEFGRNPKMQAMAASYISQLSPGKLGSGTNLNLIGNFRTVPLIRDRTLRYLNGLKTTELSKELPLLKLFEKDSLAKSIADRYINNLKKDQYFSKQNLQFIAVFTWAPKDKGFKIFRDNEKRINQVMGDKRYAQTRIENIIIKEEYDSFFKEAVNKNKDLVPWDSILNVIRVKYGNYIAEKLDRDVKSRLYQFFAEKKDKYWQQYIKYYIEMIEKDGYDTTLPPSQMHFLDVVTINNFVFSAIFYHSSDTAQMKTGLKWMEGVIRRNPTHANNIDTYANLLYKMGRKEEAIQWEEKALQFATNDKEQQYVIPSLKDNLSKMEKEIPTWIKESN